MEIADYLECDLGERNSLLLIAGHAPVQPFLTGEELDRLVTHVCPYLHYLPFPAYIVNRDWQILAMNRHLHRFFNFPDELPQTYLAGQLNVLWMIFSPQGPIRAQLGDSWETAARRNIYGFKKENLLCQFETWYTNHINALMALPDFERLWQETDVDTYLETAATDQYLPFYITKLTTPAGNLKFQSLIISLGNEDYPQIVAYIPVDEHDKAIFHRLGLPIFGGER